VVCGCFDLLVDGLGGCFLRLLWRPLKVVVDRLWGRVEWIWNLCLDGVETFDGVAVCEGEIRLGRGVGVHRCGDAGGGVVRGVGKQGRGRVDTLCVRRRAQRRMECIDGLREKGNGEYARGKDISRRGLGLNVAHAHRTYRRRRRRRRRQSNRERGMLSE